jgi:hypothetical protein
VVLHVYVAGTIERPVLLVLRSAHSCLKDVGFS